MSLKGFEGFKDVGRGMKELIRAQEQHQRNELLVQVAEQMRKKGASEKSVQLALRGTYEFLKSVRRTRGSNPDLGIPENLESTPALSEEAPGTLLSEVEAQEVHWLWERRIPLGKITILDGDPGMGKSLLAMNVAACVSTGRPMADGTVGRQGGVVLIAPEDGAGDTIKPRLEAAGGDPSQVLLLNTVESFDTKRVEIYQRPFSLSQDLEVEEAIKQMNAVLVILDPLMAVLGYTIDSSRDQEVREVFTPLAQLAERTGCAVLIIRHLNKGGSENPLYRGAGSIGIIAAARIGMIVAQDPDDEAKRILATTKNNLSKKAANLIYRVVENERGVPFIEWLGEDYHTIASLVSGASLSSQRQDILRVLRESTTPLGPKEVAGCTGMDHTTVRKTLRRMCEAGEVVRPDYGRYTAPGHASLTKLIKDNSGTLHALHR